MCAIHPIPVVNCLTPIGRGRAFGYAQEAATLHVGWDRHARRIEQSRSEVKILNQLSTRSAGSDLSRPAGQQWNPERRLVHEALVIEAMFSKEESLVGGIHDKRILSQAVPVEVLKQPAHVLVDRVHTLQVASHVDLVLRPAQRCPL